MPPTTLWSLQTTQWWWVSSGTTTTWPTERRWRSWWAGAGTKQRRSLLTSWRTNPGRPRFSSTTQRWKWSVRPCSPLNWKNVRRVVRTAEKIIGVSLPSIQDIHTSPMDCFPCWALLRGSAASGAGPLTSATALFPRPSDVYSFSYMWTVHWSYVQLSHVYSLLYCTVYRYFLFLPLCWAIVTTFLSVCTCVYLNDNKVSLNWTKVSVYIQVCERYPIPRAELEQERPVTGCLWEWGKAGPVTSDLSSKQLSSSINFIQNEVLSNGLYYYYYYYYYYY